MKRIVASILIGLGALSALSACDSQQAAETDSSHVADGAAKEPLGVPDSLASVPVSNLADDESRSDVREALQKAGIAEDRIDLFFEYVDKFNTAAGSSQIEAGKSTLGAVAYDGYAIQDALDKAFPDFIGTNCRLTVFTLTNGGYVTGEGADPRFDDQFLMQDAAAIAGAPTPFLDYDAQRRFSAFYQPIQTPLVKDTAVHAATIEKALVERGVDFSGKDYVVVSVYIHDDVDGSLLFVGHTGLAVKTDTGYLFIEKLSFSTPYQALWFDSQEQIAQYLMALYDKNEGQATASPIIFANNKQM